MRTAVALLGVLLLGVEAAAAVDVTVSSAPITRFGSAGLDQRVGGLVFRGGISMVSQDDTFGGLSGVTGTGPDGRVSFVSDRGNWVGGSLAYDENNRLFGLMGVTIEPMENSQGQLLPRQYARDAESIDTIYRDDLPVAVRVGFENLTRVADFTIENGIPGGAAREVAIPDWMSDTRTNETLEAVCIAPPASPVAGSTLLLPEEILDESGNNRAYLLGQNDKGPLTYLNSEMTSPTECAFLPNGDLLVLERGVAMLSFTMALRLVPAEQVRAGNLMVGTLLLEGSGSTIDNMESMTVHTAPDGESRILIGSDNNFNDWQRSILLEFALPPSP
jgi:hypothetical protein